MPSSTPEATIAPARKPLSGYARTKRNQEMVRAAIIELWAGGGSNTQRAIAERTKVLGHRVSQSAISAYMARWAKAGLVVPQVGSNGSAGAAWSLNWDGAPETATLRDVVAFALTRPELPAAVQRQIKTAVRTVFGLPWRTDGERLLAPCTRVGAEQLYDFPRRVYEAALAGNTSKDTAENLRGAVRRALRLAAQRGCVPIIFPRAWDDDAWERAMWTYFPDDAPGIARSTVGVYRSNWRDFAREAKEFFAGAPYELAHVGPDMIDGDMLEALAKHIVGRKGKRYLARQIRTVLSYVARHHGAGPLVGQLRTDREEVYRGRFNAGYLLDAQGKAHTGSPEGFLKILRDRGFSPEVLEFFEWYFAYSTLPDEALEGREDEFPERPANRALKARTVQKRIIGLRAWLHQALVVLDIEAKDVTLAVAFGTQYRRIQTAVLRWWKERAEAGEVSDATSSGVVDILKAAGMVARALYDRSRFRRGLTVVGTDGEALAFLEEEAASKSPAEDAWWRAYRSAMDRIDSLEERRATSADGHLKTTIKSIKRMVEHTPYTYWEALQGECLRRIRAANEAGEDNTLRYHRLVMIAFVLGILMSTGFRVAEATHLRYGTARVDHYRGQYDVRHLRPQRRVMLRPIDRKNEKRHSAYLRERYCPLWLEQEYEQRSRPWLMRRGGTSHDWLLVDAQGRPYGCPEEDEHGGGRDDLAHADRVADLRDAWQDALMPIAAALGLPIPTAWGEFAPHAVRGVFGYAIFQALGTVAAANYLGDSTSSVEDTYAAVDGSHINVADVLKTEFERLAGSPADEAAAKSTASRGTKKAKGGAGAPRPSSAAVSAPATPSAAYHDEMMALLARAEQHRLAETTVSGLVASLNAKYGVLAKVGA